ncbi:MAG: hypothetical protein M0Z56_02565 [Desulfobacteraceae bacterium]|nr:hypothetical protein [Desulfobacteraceae bacterium]
MKKQSLLTTNKFLKDRSTRDRLLIQTVLSSSAVEGIGKSAKKALEAEQMRIDLINLPAPSEGTMPKQP